VKKEPPLKRNSDDIGWDYAREVEEEPISESEGEEMNEEDIDFESDQDDVVTTGYEQEGEEDNDG